MAIKIIPRESLPEIKCGSFVQHRDTTKYPVVGMVYQTINQYQIVWSNGNITSYTPDFHIPFKGVIEIT